MSTHPDSLSDSAPTLANVLGELGRISDLSTSARQNMRSAIRTLCRVLDREPRFVPIAAPAFRKVIDQAAPGPAGVSASRWRNVKSDVRRAIRISRLSTSVRPEDVPLTPAWEELARLAPDATRRSVLRRFARFCAARQIPPDQVDDETAAAYRHHLDQSQHSKDPRRSLYDFLRAWNGFVAPASAGELSPLRIQSRSKAYTRQWSDLPASLCADVRAFHDASLKPDPFDPDAPRAVRTSTVYARDRLLRRMATVMILSGVRETELQTLADLVTPDRVKLALLFFIDRNDGKPGKQAALAADLAFTVASRWAKLPEGQLAQLRGMALRLRRRPSGLTEKNRKRLRQFGNAKVVRNLVLLPDRIVAAARRRPVDSRSARRVQTALAIALLTTAPIRIGNLLRLDRHQHFQFAFSGGARVLHLCIPASEVKNSVDLEFPVPPPLADLLELFMTTYQPLLDNGSPSSLLFPGRNGAPKCDSALRRQITDALRDELGIIMNPHLFRHLSALLFLEHHPGSYEEVRRILGHKSLTTTLQNYAGLETGAATKRYDAMILGLRSEAMAAQSAQGRR